MLARGGGGGGGVDRSASCRRPASPPRTCPNVHRAGSYRSGTTAPPSWRPLIPSRQRRRPRTSPSGCASLTLRPRGRCGGEGRGEEGNDLNNQTIENQTKETRNTKKNLKCIYKYEGRGRKAREGKKNRIRGWESRSAQVLLTSLVLPTFSPTPTRLPVQKTNPMSYPVLAHSHPRLSTHSKHRTPRPHDFTNKLTSS